MRWVAWIAQIALCALFTGSAIAEPARRVVLADSDPELGRALTTALAPWKFEIVVDPTPVPDTRAADARARGGDARFVVWRRHGDLVVYDRERGAAEFRDGKLGALDAADATAAALTVKTLMRLPPPEVKTSVTVVQPPVLEPTIDRWRIQVGLDARAGDGVSGRATAHVMVRPTRLPWRVGVAVDLGPRSDISDANFRGDAADLVVTALVSWQAQLGGFGIEPFVGVGVQRTTLDGMEGVMVRSESERSLAIQVGGWGRLVLGRWDIGPTVAVDIAPAAPSFARGQGNGNVYEAPGFALHVGAFAGIRM